MKNRMIFAVLIIAVVAVAVFIMIKAINKPTTFAVNSGKLEIGGAFGTSVSLTNITGLDIKDTMPSVDKKLNGSGLGSEYKGEFTFKDGTKARLYVNAAMPPFIAFKQGDTDFYINLDTPEKTRELFDRIKAAVPK